MDVIIDNIVEACSSISLVTVLCVESNVSSHLVEERTLSMGIVFDDLSAVLSMCFL